MGISKPEEKRACQKLKYIHDVKNKVTHITLFNLPNHPRCRFHYYEHFNNVETEAQKVQEMYPRPQIRK